MSYGVGRQGLDPVLLWFWHRLVATVSIGPLAWEPLYAVGAALKRPKKKKNIKDKDGAVRTESVPRRGRDEGKNAGAKKLVGHMEQSMGCNFRVDRQAGR